jgi:hypothetical protein
MTTVSANPIATPSEEDDLEALAIHRGEAEQCKTQQCALGARAADEAPARAVVRGDPAGPVDLVEEPVHHDEQDGDGEQSRRSLNVEAGAAEGADRDDREEPRCHGRGECDAGAGGDRSSQRAVRPDEARRQCGEYEHRLEAFAKNE